MGFKIKKLAKVAKKAAPYVGAAAVGVGGTLAYQKYAPMVKEAAQKRRADKRAQEQAALFPSVAPPPAEGPGSPGAAYQSSGDGFWDFLAKLFGLR